MTIKIAENLQMLRKEKKITQEELAEVFGVTSQSISKWELGLSCPDITLLPKIAQFYEISIDELLGYNPKTSLNSIYIQINEYMQNCDDPITAAYKISRLAAATMTPSEFEIKEAKKILHGKPSYNLTYGQGDGGVRICGDQSVFVCNFENLRSYDITTIRKVSKYLNHISDFNTLRVLFGLFDLMVNNSITKTYTIEEITSKCNLSMDEVHKAFNNLDVYFDKEEYKKNGIEKYSLQHFDQVPLLITFLIPTLDKYDSQLVD